MVSATYQYLTVMSESVTCIALKMTQPHWIQTRPSSHDSGGSKHAYVAFSVTL